MNFKYHQSYQFIFKICLAMPKLRKISPAEVVSKEMVDTYKANLKANRATLPAVQTVTDDVLKTWEKMGPVKREEYGAVLDVFLENNKHLKPPLSIEEAETNLFIFDGSDELIAAHKAEIVYLERRKAIAGSRVLNVLKACERETTYLAEEKDDEDAHITQIELNKLIKTTRGSSNKKSDEPLAAKPK